MSEHKQGTPRLEEPPIGSDRHRPGKLLPQELANEIILALRGLRPAEVIVFGSRATGQATEESDLDLVVVLNKQGFSRDYSEAVRNRMLVHRCLRSLRSEMDVDVLVYTRDEWLAFLSSDSSFAREIKEKGVKIL